MRLTTRVATLPTTFLVLLVAHAPDARSARVTFAERVLVADFGTIEKLLAIDMDSDHDVDFVTQVRFESPAQDTITFWENVPGGSNEPPVVFEQQHVQRFEGCPSGQIDTFALDFVEDFGGEVGTYSGNCESVENPNAVNNNAQIYLFPDWQHTNLLTIESPFDRSSPVASDVLQAGTGEVEELLYVTDATGDPQTSSVRIAFAPGFVVTVASGRLFQLAFPADIDGDGREDVLTSDPAQLSWWKTLLVDPDSGLDCPAHDPCFDERFVWGAFGNELLASQRVISAGDVDGDLDIDVVFSALQDTSPFLTGRLVWLESDGELDPTFVEHVIDSNGLVAGKIALGDLDGDGDLDVVLGETTTPRAEIQWYENLAGDGSLWSAPRRVAVVEASGGTHFWVRDMDGDGDDDVLAVWSSDFARSETEVRLYESRPLTGLRNVLVNSKFDTSLDGWPLIQADIGSADWNAMDVDGLDSSGSARLTNFSGAAFSTMGIGQCASVTGGTEYDFGAAIYVVDGLQTTGSFSFTVLWASDSSCADVIGVANTANEFSQGQWIVLDSRAQAPVGAASAQLRASLRKTVAGGEFIAFIDDAILLPEPRAPLLRRAALVALLALAAARRRRQRDRN